LHRPEHRIYGARYKKKPTKTSTNKTSTKDESQNSFGSTGPSERANIQPFGTQQTSDAKLNTDGRPTFTVKVVNTGEQSDTSLSEAAISPELAEILKVFRPFDATGFESEVVDIKCVDCNADFISECVSRDIF